jgi:hypothetical protein
MELICQEAVALHHEVIDHLQKAVDIFQDAFWL